MKKLFSIASFLLSLSFFSCATLPKETVDLSILLNKQLEVLEQQQTLMVDLYFDEKKNYIIKFLDEVWYNRYIDNLFKQQTIKDYWNKAVNTQSSNTRMEIVKGITIVTDKAYRKEKEKYLDPLEAQRKKYKTLITEEYGKAKKMNEAITGNISKVYEIHKKQREYLSKAVDVKKMDESIHKILMKLDDITDGATKGIEQYEQNKDKIHQIINKVLKKKK